MIDLEFDDEKRAMDFLAAKISEGVYAYLVGVYGRETNRTWLIRYVET